MSNLVYQKQRSVSNKLQCTVLSCTKAVRRIAFEVQGRMGTQVQDSENRRRFACCLRFNPPVLEDSRVSVGSENATSIDYNDSCTRGGVPAMLLGDGAPPTHWHSAGILGVRPSLPLPPHDPAPLWTSIVLVQHF